MLNGIPFDANYYNLPRSFLSGAYAHPFYFTPDQILFS